MKDLNKFVSKWVSPPGDTIKDLLDEKGWNEDILAYKLKCSSLYVHQLIKGNASISKLLACQLEEIIGGNMDFWLCRDAEYQYKRRLNVIPYLFNKFKDKVFKVRITLSFIDVFNNITLIHIDSIDEFEDLIYQKRNMNYVVNSIEIYTLFNIVIPLFPLTRGIITSGKHENN